VTAIFIAVLVALVVKLTWELSASNVRYSQEAEQANKQYSNETHERIARTCADAMPTALAKCADEIVKSSHEAQIAQHDLAAQRGMHLWAIAMFWVTVASVTVTGFGIWLVWRTLDETSSATKLLGEDFVAAHPPKLGAYQIDCCVVPDADIFAEVFIINEGRTDADMSPHVSYATFVWCEKLPRRFPVDGVRLRKDSLKAGEPYNWKIESKDRLSQQDVSRIEAGSISLYLMGLLRFDDRRKVFHRTLFCRRYDPQSKRWVHTNDPDYEYQT
jgi:hypothetical protein